MRKRNIAVVASIVCSLILSCASTSLADPASSAVPAAKAVVGKKYPSFPVDMLYKTMRIRAKHIFSSGVGSGVVVDLSRYGFRGNRYVLTAAHVIHDHLEGVARKIQVEYRFATKNAVGKTWIQAQVVAYDRNKDIAILRLARELPSAATLAHEDKLKIGDALCAVGSPSGSAITPSFGFLTAKEIDVLGEQWNSKTHWQSSTTIFFGNSGGPLWDPNRNEVIGIIVSGIRPDPAQLAPNISFFVPVPTINSFMKSSAVKKAAKSIMEHEDKKKNDKGKKKNERKPKNGKGVSRGIRIDKPVLPGIPQR